jgi:hypothetical protein
MHQFQCEILDYNVQSYNVKVNSTKVWAPRG